MAEQDRRDILAANRRVDALGAAGERCRLPHHEARDIEDVDAEILDDEPIALGEIGLRGIDVEPRSEGEARAAGSADPALEIGRASCRERGCLYVSTAVVAVSLQQQNTHSYRQS